MLLTEWLQDQPEEITFDLNSNEEEHEVATIVENPLKTWNKLFYQDFLEVFMSTVEEIHDNGYPSVFISGASAARIEEFQFLMAGYCHLDVYNKYKEGVAQ